MDTHIPFLNNFAFFWDTALVLLSCFYTKQKQMALVQILFLENQTSQLFEVSVLSTHSLF